VLSALSVIFLIWINYALFYRTKWQKHGSKHLGSFKAKPPTAKRSSFTLDALRCGAASSGLLWRKRRAEPQRNASAHALTYGFAPLLFCGDLRMP